MKSYSSFKPCMHILPTVQKIVWPMLQAASKLEFVLYGGTAIALRLGHRTSIDFDFFTDKALDKDKLRQSFSFISECTILQDQVDTFSILNPDNVKISFFGNIGFGRFGELNITEDKTLLVASLDDLMATKLKVILQRIEAKDYKDIAAMLTADISLDRGLAIAREMFGNNFQPSESLKAMVYFKGGDLETLTSEEKKILINAVSEVRNLPSVAIKSHRLI